MAIVVLALSGCGQPIRSAPQSEPPDFEPPPQELVDLVVAHVDGEFEGKVSEIYGTGATDRAGWKEAEPGFNLATKITDKNEDDPVYAVFFKGNLRLFGPPPATGGIKEEEQSPPETGFANAGRAVFGPEGEIIAMSLWPEPRDATPPFGPHLDDR